MKTILPILALVVGGAPFAGAELRVFPEAIELRGARDSHALVVQQVAPDGLTRDVTGEAVFTPADSGVAAWVDGALVPRGDGSTKVWVEHGGERVEVPVAVRGAGERPELSFRLDVMPVFMRAGCNSGSCHGAGRGQDGFMLSLFGYDPTGDYRRLTRELIGRRVNVAAPAQSLLLEKSIGAVTHTGGECFTADSDYYATLHEWIAAGAPDDGEAVPEVEGIELFPPKFVLRESGDPAAAPSQQMLVRARYSDGSTRDVTSLAVFLTNDDSVAEIGDDGLARARSAGGAFVFARFDKYTVGSELVVLPAAELAWPETPQRNYIDELVQDKLRKLQIPPSGPATDEAFLRRAYLDLIGLPPTVAEYHSFVEDSDPAKREKLVDSLLAREEFIDLWAMKWGEMLQIRSGGDARGGRPRKAAWKYYQWVREQVAQNRPVDELVAELVAATGSNLSEPVANFYTTHTNQPLTALQRAENVAQVFMGTRIQCAQCHNHPFDRWTMDDYYGFVSFFEGVRGKGGANAQELYIYNDNARQTSEHPVDGRKVPPKFLGGAAPDTGGEDPRAALAEWLTSGDNEAFAQNLANRAWAHFFGRGIVEPVDDMRITNPPSNGALLDALAAKLVGYDFDMRRLVRDIVTSHTYGLSSTANAANARDERFFSRSYVRRLQAEVLLDTLSAATETVSRFSRTPVEFRAVELFEGGRGDYFLDTFGAASRETVCACEVSKEANLAQALHLINGNTLSNKLRESRVVYDLVQSSAAPEEIVEQLYLRTLSRKPSEAEVATMIELVGHDAESADANVRRAAYDDVFWALVNSTEFGFNH